MAGHSKFKNIMFRKGAQDKKRSKLFSKLSREITVAAKTGMPDPDGNPRLRSAIIAARVQNMPRDRIERAIQKSSEVGGSDWQEMKYEGFGSGGVGVIVEALTDNRNRTASELRTIFSKFGGGLGESGSAEHLFQRCGIIHYRVKDIDEDELFEVAAELGAEDCSIEDEVHEVVTSLENFAAVREGLEKKFSQPLLAQLQYRPLVQIPVEINTLRTLMTMLDLMDDNDDVQQVWSNFDADAQTMAQLESE